MRFKELLRWQWEGYARYHQSSTNLKLHMLFVPLFWLGNLGLPWALASDAWWRAGLCLLAMIVSVALQGRGHAQEPVPAEPFTSRGNALARIFLEQWVSYPRFVLTGAWWRALQHARAREHAALSGGRS